MKEQIAPGSLYAAETRTAFPATESIARRATSNRLRSGVPVPPFRAAFTTAFAAALAFAAPLAAQDLPLDGRDGRNLLLENFRPKSMLRVPETQLTRAKFPVVDVHTHFRHKFRGSAGELEAWIKLMDRNNIDVCVSLDGQWGELVDEHAKLLWTRHKDRFAIFANIDWQGGGKADDPATWDCNRPDFARRVARELASAKERGVCGVKIFKGFGL